MKCLVVTKNVPWPIRFSFFAQGWYRENKSVGENRWVKMFAVAGYHAVLVMFLLFCEIWLHFKISRTGIKLPNSAILYNSSYLPLSAKSADVWPCPGKVMVYWWVRKHPSGPNNWTCMNHGKSRARIYWSKVVKIFRFKTLPAVKNSVYVCIYVNYCCLVAQSVCNMCY